MSDNLGIKGHHNGHHGRGQCGDVTRVKRRMPVLNRCRPPGSTVGPLRIFLRNSCP
jgi:hypothetical protein